MHRVFYRSPYRFCIRSGALSGGTNVHAAFGVSDERACGGCLRGDRVATRWDTLLLLSIDFQRLLLLFSPLIFYTGDDTLRWS